MFSELVDIVLLPPYSEIGSKLNIGLNSLYFLGAML